MAPFSTVALLKMPERSFRLDDRWRWPSKQSEGRRINSHKSKRRTGRQRSQLRTNIL